jgi:hypothetical protein
MAKKDSLPDFSNQNQSDKSIAAAEFAQADFQGISPPPLQLKMESGQFSSKDSSTPNTLFSVSQPIQRKTNSKQGNFHQSAQASKAQLSDKTKSKMEHSFQADFSNVNIHQNSEQASQIGAKAFTQGNDIHFSSGSYQPNSSSGQELIGHELSHVVQQRAGRVQPTTSVGGLPVNDSTSLEAEADSAGKAASQAQPVQQKSTGPNGAPQGKAIQGWGIPDWMKDAGNAAAGAVSSAWETTKDVAGAAASSVGDAGVSLFNGAKSIATGAAQGIKSVVTGAAKGASSAAKGILGGIKSAGSGIISGVGSTLKGIGSGIKQGVSGVWDGAKQVAHSGIDAVSGFAGSVGEASGQIFNDPMGAASTLWDGAKDSASTLVSGIGSGISSAAGGIWEGAKSAGSGALQGISEAAHGVLDGLKQAGGGIWKGIKEAGGGLLSGIGSALMGLVKGGFSLADAIAEVTVGFADKLMGPEGQDINQSEIPSEHGFDEYMTDLAYLGITNDNDLTDADRERLTRTGYDPSTFFQFEGEKGFQMVYVLPLPYDANNPATHELKNPALAIRGSEVGPDFFKDWGSDFDYSQVGNRQFEANKDNIEASLQFLSSMSPSGKVNLSGHSLGGALAQIITAHHPGYIARLTTFQAPGISQDTADLYEENTANIDDSQLPEIAHHIVEDGLVYKVGETSLEGDFYKHNIDESFFGDVHVATLVDQEGRTDADGNHQAASQHAVEKFDSFPDEIKRKILEIGRKGLSPIITRLFNLIDGT